MKRIHLMAIVWSMITIASFASEDNWTETGGATSMTGQNNNDQAGYSVAISSDGTTVAVGEPGWSGAGSISGRVRTYRLLNGVWTETGGTDSMTGGSLTGLAGGSVAISADGMTVAVGEPGWNEGDFSGRVRTYRLEGGVWTQTGGATSMTGENVDDQAGFSVAINADGTMVAVGEPFWNGVGGVLTSSGRVRTYRLQGGVWAETGGATSMTGQVAGDEAGYSVSMSADGMTVAVGEPAWSGAGSASGRVRTYKLLNGVWTQTGGATSMTGEIAGDVAGYSVAINSDGTIVAVGEPAWSGAGSASGRVRTYKLLNGVWTQTGGATSMTGQNITSEAGYSVAINSDGTIVAVGERGWNSFRGRVRAYKLLDGMWIELGNSTDMTGENDFNVAGSSVAISSNGNRIAVGEPFWNGPGSLVAAGRVRVYQYGVTVNFIINENYILNSNLAGVSYSNISQGTSSGQATNPGGIGQGAVFTAYRIMVQGK